MAVTTEEPGARDRLLARIYAYVLEHGLADLTLRPLGAAVDASPRTLLYHFGSKDELVAAIVERVRAAHVRLFEDWSDRSGDYRGATLALGLWQWSSAPRHERLIRVGLEAHVLALRDGRRPSAIARGMLADWSVPLERRLERAGFARDRAASLATLLCATLRGLLIELSSTGERSRADRAFRSFVAAIEFPAEEGG